MTTPLRHATALELHTSSCTLEVSFDDGSRYTLPYELLRVYSPSAEVRGHGPGQETLQIGKRTIQLNEIEPVGNYGLRPVFSDGHDSGIYTWDYLHWLGANREALWEDYLQRLEKAGYTRESGRDATAIATTKTGCASH
jgi:DUF971 family protein